MAEQPDLRLLVELVKEVQADVRGLKGDMEGTKSTLARLECKVDQGFRATQHWLVLQDVSLRMIQIVSGHLAAPWQSSGYRG